MKKYFLITLLAAIILQIPALAKSTKPEESNHIEYMNLAWWEKYNDEYLTVNLLKLYKNN